MNEWEPIINLRGKIHNVFIFVADSLRWDYLPQKVKELGLSVKTVASSLFTASSFPSIASGLYPPGHGVWSFSSRPSINQCGLFSQPGINSSFWCSTTWVGFDKYNTPLHNLLGNPPAVPLEELEEPFIYMESDKGGHCPWGREYEVSDIYGCLDFFKKLNKLTRSQIQTKYRESIEQSTQRFLGKIDFLKKKNLFHSTLIIFTSDHGELLGEYGGIITHARPACPELVYVPTTFIHPHLPQNKIINGFMRHVDYLPLISFLMGIDELPSSIDGSLPWKNDKKYGLNFILYGLLPSNNWLKKKTKYHAWSVWDNKGGYVFHKMNPFLSALKDIWKMTRKYPPFYFHFGEIKRSPPLLKVKKFLDFLFYQNFPFLKFGTPKFNMQEAKKYIKEYLNKRPFIQDNELTEKPDSELENRLRNLGYLD